jgi:hypothetical protein
VKRYSIAPWFTRALESRPEEMGRFCNALAGRVFAMKQWLRGDKLEVEM